MKKLITLSILFLSFTAQANVYDRSTPSTFPIKIRQLINKEVRNNCDTKHFHFSPVEETKTITDTDIIFHLELSAGMEYEGEDPFIEIAVDKKTGIMEVSDIRCPGDWGDED